MRIHHKRHVSAKQPNSTKLSADPKSAISGVFKRPRILIPDVPTSVHLHTNQETDQISVRFTGSLKNQKTIDRIKVSSLWVL